MSRVCHIVSTRVVLMVTSTVISVVIAEGTVAQQAAWNVLPGATYPLVGANAQGTTPASVSYGPSVAPISRGPLARLVNNPDRASGLPPFALADQNGMIQRYVEPVPGIDLAPFVGQVVVVRHDTGRTLLASQLELPPQPLYPMVGSIGENAANAPAAPSFGAVSSKRQEGFVQQAQYADNDDATVELLDEGEVLPNGQGMMMSPAPMQGGMMYSEGGYPVYPEAMPPGNPGFGPGFGAPCCDPMQCDPAGTEWLPENYGMAPCPKCGRYHRSPGCVDEMGYGSVLGHDQRQPAHVFAAVEINFLRLHLMESAVGKLSEKYEFSPRFIAGFTGIGPIDGRVRYWLYGRETGTVGDDDDSIRVKLHVLDLEGTHRFGDQCAEVTLAAGVRLASLDLTDEEDDAKSGTDLLGLTMAADGRTRLAAFQAGRLAWVYGGRLSILGGDWGGEDGGFVEQRVRDDNVVCHELYAGLECARCYRRLDLHARLAYELQNWHSDVLSASDEIESIGFVGPSIRLGAEF